MKLSTEEEAGTMDICLQTWRRMDSRTVLKTFQGRHKANRTETSAWREGMGWSGIRGSLANRLPPQKQGILMLPSVADPKWLNEKKSIPVCPVELWMPGCVRWIPGKPMPAGSIVANCSPLQWCQRPAPWSPEPSTREGRSRMWLKQIPS